MVEVDFTAGGWADLGVLSFKDRMDVMHKLELVEQFGIAGEQKIGEISADVAIYLLFSGHHNVVVAFCDLSAPEECRVFAIEPFALTDLARKTAFVNKAVSEIGIASRVNVF